MDKYKELKKKLLKLSKQIEKTKVSNDASKECLKRCKEYVDELIIKADEKSIKSSNGAVLGLTKGVSDFDEICSNNDLMNLLSDVDVYYSKECKEL